MRRRRWRHVGLDCVLGQQLDMTGGAAPEVTYGSSMSCSIRPQQKFNRGVTGMRTTEGKVMDKGLAAETNRGGRNPRKTATAERTPATKSGGLGASWMGLLGGE